MTGRIASLPTREQINLPVQEQLIVELYASRCQLKLSDRNQQFRHLAFSIASSLPAAFPDLRWEAGGATAGPAGAQLRASD